MKKLRVFKTFSKKLITITDNLTKLEVVSGWAQLIKPTNLCSPPTSCLLHLLWYWRTPPFFLLRFFCFFKLTFGIIICTYY